jgi:hypothetical protein
VAECIESYSGRFRRQIHFCILQEQGCVMEVQNSLDLRSLCKRGTAPKT